MAVIGRGHYCTAELQLTITFIIDPFISIIMSLIYHGLCYLGHLFRLKGWLLMFGFKLDENSSSAPGTFLLCKVLYAASSVFFFNSFDPDMDSLTWFNCLVDVSFSSAVQYKDVFSATHFKALKLWGEMYIPCIIFELYSAHFSCKYLLVGGRGRGRNVRMRQTC